MLWYYRSLVNSICKTALKDAMTHEFILATNSKIVFNYHAHYIPKFQVT